MAHFAVICPAVIGHLNPRCVLGRELQRRGHQITLFGIPDVQLKVKQSRTEDSYKQNALRLQSAIQQAGGVSRAADIIEQAILTRKPVFSGIN